MSNPLSRAKRAHALVSADPKSCVELLEWSHSAANVFGELTTADYGSTPFSLWRKAHDLAIHFGATSVVEILQLDSGSEWDIAAQVVAIGTGEHRKLNIGFAALVEWCTKKIEEASPAPAEADTKSNSQLTVSKPGKLILGALLKQYPALQSIEEICKTVNGWSERTIGPELTMLIDAGLAVRPRGKAKGATLTAEGKALAEKFTANE